MRQLLLAVLCLLITTSRASTQSVTNCEPPERAAQILRPSKYNEVWLAEGDVQTIVLAVREIIAICVRGPAASAEELLRRDTLLALVNQAIEREFESHAGGLAMVNVFSANQVVIGRLAAAVCTPRFVNIEPFIVKTVNGPRLPPTTGNARVQLTLKGKVIHDVQLFSGGAAIPNPGEKYYVVVSALLDKVNYFQLELVYDHLIQEISGRPGCRVVAPQLTPVKVT